MGSRSHIAKWGSSLAIRIPKPVAEQWGVREGSRIEMVPRGDQLVMSKRAFDLTEMLARMSRISTSAAAVGQNSLSTRFSGQGRWNMSTGAGLRRGRLRMW